MRDLSCQRVSLSGWDVRGVLGVRLNQLRHERVYSDRQHGVRRLRRVVHDVLGSWPQRLHVVRSESLPRRWHVQAVHVLPAWDVPSLGLYDDGQHGVLCV